MTASEPEIIYFDAVLTPNQSLSRRGANMAVLAFGIVSFISGLAFWRMGALPVAGFLGLDVFLLWLAIRHVRQTAQQSTEIRVTARAVTLTHRPAKGESQQADVPSAFARVEAESAPGGGVGIAYGRTKWVIGRFLTRMECEALATSLNRALNRARAERVTA
jgi:uncharacterized membrane protein